MTSQSNQWMLFGFDLSRSIQFLRLGVHQILHDESSWLASKFQPKLWVKVGAQWQGWQDTGSAASALNPPHLEQPMETCFFCASIPADLVLFKKFQFPESEEALLADAVAMEVAVSSPFAEQERIAGWKIINRENATLEVLIAISSRTAAEASLTDLASEFDAPMQNPAQVATLHGEAGLVEFEGYGDDTRERMYLRSLRRSAAGIGIVVAALCFAIALPVVSSAYRSARLAAQFESIKEDASIVDRHIDSLQLQRARLTFIADDVTSRPDYAARLEDIAAISPDGTFLEGLRIEGSRIEVTGYSDNAANYLRLLTEQSGYTDVSARSAFVREPRSGLERFTIDWSFIPEGK